MPFLDTNVFLRYLTADDPIKAKATYALFQQLKAGRVQATTSEVVIAEVCYVLSSRAHFNLHPHEIQARLQPVVTVKGLKLPSRRRLLRALDVYARYPSLDFEDALIAAQMEQSGISTLVSYDRGFDKLGWITRVEPEAKDGRKAA
ncbi:PIN domain-containing protein [Nitrolancea hollandica]|uniref:PilT protein domain protein n=1 Tax=Nitrolancea hollandica Lb TaxID=1129897 RepID=I4EL18_9BACT|nr:PIN domain-containing protein [Nitrolancea hollandica]CCF85380.1 PilT protein domain protein [Nitrolancea hollandica Lb]